MVSRNLPSSSCKWYIGIEVYLRHLARYLYLYILPFLDYKICVNLKRCTLKIRPICTVPWKVAGRCDYLIFRALYAIALRVRQRRFVSYANSDIRPCQEQHEKRLYTAPQRRPRSGRQQGPEFTQKASSASCFHVMAPFEALRTRQSQRLKEEEDTDTICSQRYRRRHKVARKKAINNCKK